MQILDISNEQSSKHAKLVSMNSYMEAHFTAASLREVETLSMTQHSTAV